MPVRSFDPIHTLKPWICCQLLISFITFGLAIKTPALEVNFDTTGDWLTGTNWNGGLVPGTGDRANIISGNTATLAADGGTINSLRVGSTTNGTLIIDGTGGGRLTINDTGGTGADAVIGYSGSTGLLRLINGALFNANNAGSDGEIYVGQGAGSSGTVEVDAGTITAARGFYIAEGHATATGSVVLGDGLGSADSILNTSGANLEVGTTGSGTLTVNADAVVNVNSNNLVIAQNLGSSGHVILNGGTVTINTSGDLNMNAGDSIFTINAGSFSSRAINLTNNELGSAVLNLNGGSISTINDIVDGAGLTTINYNGTQVTVGGGDISAEILNVGTTASLSTSVVMNLVATASAAGDVQTQTFTVNRGLTLGSAGVDATLNINNGFLDVRNGIRDGGSVTALNVGTAGSAGKLIIHGISPTAASSSQIDSFSVGANGTLTAKPNVYGINAIQTGSANLTGGTLELDTAIFTGANTASGNATTWQGGSGVWDGSLANWDKGQPEGYTIAANTQMTVIQSATPVTGTISLTTAGWTLADDGTITGNVVVSNNSELTAGPTRAILTGGGLTTVDVVRNTDLIISNATAAGTIGTASTSYLEILGDATLTVNANVYVGGAGQGTVDQSGDMTINGNLYFGQNPTGGDQGGTWNLNAGKTLTVTGDIEERNSSTNNAQLYIRGGTLDVAGDITVQRLDLGATSGQNSILELKLGQTVTSTGTTQIGSAARGIINVTDDTSVLQAGNMTIGAGNANGSALNVSAGLAGTFDGTLTLGNNTGTNNRPSLVVNGTGTVNVTKSGNINTLSGAADLSIVSGNLVTLALSENGTLGIARDLLLHNSSTGTQKAVVTLADNATLNIVRHLDYRDGTTEMTISGGTLTVGGNLLLDSPAAAASFLRIEGASSSISVAGNFTQATGNLLSFAPLTGGLSSIQVTGTSSTATLAGDIEVDMTSFTSTSTAIATLSTWNTGSGTWNSSDAEWLSSAGMAFNPDGVGVLTTGQRFTILELLGASGSLTSSANVLTADWTLDTTTDAKKADLVYGGANLDSLPVHAQLSAVAAGSPIIIDRSTDLTIAPVAGMSASRLTVENDVTLNISDGTLNGSGPHLIIGSASTDSLVTQNGGFVNVDGNLIFGYGSGTKGGEYDLFGGTLHVYGDVVEGSTSGTDANVDLAQLYVDGGTLIVDGNITLQSFRLGNLEGKTGTYTQNNAAQTLTNTGTFYIGESGTGVYTLQNGVMVLGTTEIGNSVTGNGTWNISGGKISTGATTIGRSGTALVEITGVAAGEEHSLGTTNIGGANNDTSDGTLTINLASSSEVVNAARIGIGVGGKGTLNLIEGTLNANNGIFVADDGNSSAANGRTATLVIGDGTSNPTLNIKGANLEAGETGTGVVTMNSGTYNQISSNLVIGQSVGSDATFNMNGGVANITNLIRISNNGKGLLNITGGTMNVGGLIDMGNTGNSDADASIQISGGVLNANASLSIAVQANTLGSVTVSGGELNVTGSTTVGTSGIATLTITGLEATKEHDLGNLAVGIANDNSSSGTVLINMANPTDVINVGSVTLGNGGKSSFTLTEGTFNATAGFQNAANANSSEANGRTATVVIGDGSSNPTLNVSGGNFETANYGTGEVTMNSGTLNQTSNNVIIGQTSTSNGKFTLNGGTMNVSNMVRVGNSAGGTGSFYVAGGHVIASVLDFGANNGTGSFHTYEQTAGLVDVGAYNISRGTNQSTISGGILNVGAMNLHELSSDPGATVNLIGGDINITNDLNYRAGRSVVTVGGAADLAIGRDLLMNAGGSALEPSKFIVSGADANISVTRNLTITGTDERYLSYIPDISSPSLVSAIEVSGIVTLAGVLELLDWATLLSSSSGYGDIMLINNLGSSPVSGSFFQASGAAWNEGDLWESLYADNSTWRLSYQGGDGNDVVLTAVVPEPSRVLLFALACFSVCLRRRRGSWA